MKISILLIAIALIFLFISPSLSSRTRPDEDVVYDSEGNPLQIGETYTIYGFSSVTNFIRLVSGTSTNDTREEYVIQNGPFSLLPGTPFTFTPQAIPIGENSVKVGVPLVIQYPSGIPADQEGLIWKVSDREGIPVPIITTGGEVATTDSCLRIVKPTFPTYPTSYVFEHCPYLCAAGFKFCYQVGIYQNNEGYRHLSTRGSESLRVSFVKNPLIKMV